MELNNLAESVLRTSVLWDSLGDRWSELRLPGSKFSPEQFLSCLMLSLVPENGEELAGRVLEANKKLEEMSRDYRLSSALLTSSHKTAIFGLLAYEAIRVNLAFAGPVAAPELDPVPASEAPVHAPVAACPQCGHDFESCRIGAYLQPPAAIEPDPIPAEQDSPATMKFGCCHIGSDGKCLNCTSDRLVDCSACSEQSIEAKAKHCANKDCEAVYCDQCAERNLNGKGYCDDCAMVSCDGEDCGQSMERGEEIRCGNPKCASEYAYCKECAAKLLNEKGECPDCSGEEEYTCDDCGCSVTQSRVSLCKDEDCEHSYCKECAERNLANGYCEDCRTVSCDGECQNEIARGEERRCANSECRNARCDYCPDCAANFLNEKGECPDCSGEEEYTCDDCGRQVTESKVALCKNHEDCEHSYCKECAKSRLRDNGYCDDCQSVECDSCGDRIDRGQETACKEKDCKTAYCKSCAERLVDSRGRCGECTNVETSECTGCGNRSLKPRLTRCRKHNQCGNEYCPACKEDYLENGVCSDCDCR